MLIIYYMIVPLYFTFIFGSISMYLIRRYDLFDNPLARFIKKINFTAPVMDHILSSQMYPNLYKVDHYISYSDTLADLYRLPDIKVGDIAFIANMQKYFMYTNDLKFVELEHKQKDLIIKNTYLISCIGAFLTIESVFKRTYPIQEVNLEEKIIDVYFI